MYGIVFIVFILVFILIFEYTPSISQFPLHVNTQTPPIFLFFKTRLILHSTAILHAAGVREVFHNALKRPK